MESKDSFPVDVKPLIRSGVLLLVVFVALCVMVYLQEGESAYSAGILLLASVFGFAAYTQRQDSFRMVGTLVVGAILCLLLLLYSGEEAPEEGAKPGGSRTPRYAEPEGL